MKNTLSLMAIGAMFAGSVLADSDSAMNAQKMQIQQQNEMNARAAVEGTMPVTQPMTMPTNPITTSNDVQVHDHRDIVGMPLDGNNEPSNVIGGDHIIEMDDGNAEIDHNTDAHTNSPMTVDGRME